MPPIEIGIDNNMFTLKTENDSKTASRKLPDGTNVRVVDSRVGGLIKIEKEYRFGQASTSFSTDQPGTTTFSTFDHKFKIKST